jgi:hypothetical protein
MNQLIEKLNKKWISVMWLTLIHLSFMTFNVTYIVFGTSLIFMAMVGVKLFIFCRFMDS